MAEVLINDLSGGRYLAYSAGAKPSGIVNPYTIETLKRNNHNTDGLRSKSIDEFTKKDFDVVVTVCDNAKESCPVWPKNTKVLHWGFEDPAEFEGNDEETRTFFNNIYLQIRKRIEGFLA
jgi:arsenate reductase